MKLLENYSRSCSVDIKSKPFIFQKYFPLPSDLNKFITIQNKSGMPAKDFSYFNEILDILKPYLDKENIKVIHLGQDSPPLNNTINLNNQTNLGQSCYIIKKSLAHISVDSWSCHYAAVEEIPLVALYGSTTIENHSPYHFNPDKTIFLESHRNGNKASFQREENPKTVDFIAPEVIAKSVCKLLNIEFNYEFRTLLIGKNYQNKIIESCMDSVININTLGIQNIICRMDYLYNLNNLVNQARVGKISILTDKVIPIELLQQIRGNIVELIYEIKEDNDPNFCKQLIENKIPYRLFSKLPDDKLNLIKLNFLDYAIIHKVESKIPDFIKDKDINNLYFKGGKYIISNKGLFCSYWSYKNGTTISQINHDPQKLKDINIEDLSSDIDYLYFLEKF